MRRLKIDLRIEGLTGLAVAPVSAVETLWCLPVPVGFSSSSYAGGDVEDVGGVVACFGQALREQPSVARQLVVVVAVAAVILSAGEGLVEPNVQGAAARRADGSGGVCASEANAFFGDAVHVGSLDERVSVTTKLYAEVVAKDPEDVRPALG